jgi:iron(II)-dependent oxidoreductase
VTDVSWHDAAAYCAWLNQETGRRYFLPSEAEWEKAASWAGGEPRGTEREPKRRYPWGPEWLDRRCNVGGSGTTAVTAHPSGASASGVEDLLGNVQEWTRSRWGRQPAQPDYGYPYDPADGREILDPAVLPVRARLVHRGGSYKSAPADVRCTARGNALSDSKVAWRGFRVAVTIA